MKATPIYPVDPERFGLDFTDVEFHHTTETVRFTRSGYQCQVLEVTKSGKTSVLFEIQTQEGLRGKAIADIRLSKLLEALDRLGTVVWTSFWYPKGEVDLTNAKGQQLILTPGPALISNRL